MNEASIAMLKEERDALIRIAAIGGDLCEYCVHVIDLGGRRAQFCNDADFCCEDCGAPCPCRECQLGSKFYWNGKRISQCDKTCR